MQVLDPMQIKDWDEFLINNPDYNFFYSSEWAKVLKDSYNYSPQYFSSIKENSIKALIPMMEVSSIVTGKRGVSLPFTDFCDPLVNSHSQFEELFNEMKDFGRKRNWSFIEVRGGNGEFEGNEPFSETYIHILELGKTEDELLKCFDGSTRRNIKKANRKDVEIKVCTSHEAMNNFYELNCLTRKRHGIPPQPKSFFSKIYNEIIKPGHGVIIEAIHNNKAIASCIYFHIGKKALYKYGASDFAYQDLRANNLLMWEAIKYYNDKGFKELNFGRTDKDNEGLRRYKLGWGTKEHLKKYYKYDLKNDVFVKDSSKGFNYHKILEKCPVSVLKIIGNVAYKHIG